MLRFLVILCIPIGSMLAAKGHIHMSALLHAVPVLALIPVRVK
jgi:hypothetical protein